MKNDYVYIEDVGWLHPIKDFETIKWAYEYLRKRSKVIRTRRINDFLEKYEKQLESMGAFELLTYIRAQVTEKQREKRMQSKAMTEAKWVIHFEGLKELQRVNKAKKEFMQKMKGNICLN